MANKKIIRRFNRKKATKKLSGWRTLLNKSTMNYREWSGRGAGGRETYSNFFFTQEGRIPKEPQRLDHSTYKLFQNGSELNMVAQTRKTQVFARNSQI